MQENDALENQPGKENDALENQPGKENDALENPSEEIIGTFENPSVQENAIYDPSLIGGDVGGGLLGGLLVMIFKRVSILVLAVALAFFLVSVLRGNDSGYSDYDIEMDKLVLQKNKLISEIGNISSEIITTKGNTSYISFIFTDLDAALYNTAYMVMNHNDPIGGEELDGEVENTTNLPSLVGVMALSPSELPGLDGNITRAQFDEMIAKGWSVALYWSGEGDLREYIDAMKVHLESAGIDALPSVMLFKPETYTPDCDAILLECGISVAIHHGENDISLIDNTAPDGVWHPGSVGWKSGMPATLLRRQIEAEGGYGFLEISMKAYEGDGDFAFFELDANGKNLRFSSFERMISVISTSAKAGDLEVLSPEDTRYKVERYFIDGVDIDIEFEKKRLELEAQLKEVERRIEELYKEHHSGGN